MSSRPGRVVLFLLLFVASTATAVDFSGPVLHVPIAGRTPGVGGTLWQTDLVVSNLSHRGQALNAIVRYTETGSGRTRELPLALAARETAVLRDVVRSGFGLESSTGSIRIEAALGDHLGAHARIYNVDSAGAEYGQTVPALPSAALAFHTDLTGLSGTNGNRTNIGVANPVGNDHTIVLTLFDATGTRRGEKSLELVGGATVQINDVFAWFGVGPLDGAMVHVGSGKRVYSYASVVHGSTGDPTFVIGNESSMALPWPQCADPARLTVSATWNDTWIVVLNSSALSTINALKIKYGFEPSHIYTSIGGFAATLDPRVVTQLQCEPAVSYIEQNTIGGPAS